MPKCFISYRREDEPVAALLIRDKLVERFGEASTFFDVDSIPLGVDFREFLNEQVSQCEVLLAVIGNQWLNARGDDGSRRLDSTEDFVRIEIEAALSRDILVVPVLVATAMPKPSALPDSMQQLAYRNAASVRPGRDLHSDIDGLVKALERHAPQIGSRCEPVDTKSDTKTAEDSSRLPDLTGMGWTELELAPGIPVACPSCDSQVFINLDGPAECESCGKHFEARLPELVSTPAVFVGLNAKSQGLRINCPECETQTEVGRVGSNLCASCGSQYTVMRM